MKDNPRLTRRQLVGTSIAAAAAVTSGPLAPSTGAANQPPTTRFAKPLAQDYIVVATRPSRDLITDDPALTKLPSGGLFATWTFRGTQGPKKWGNSNRFQSARSEDDGKTWQRLESLDLVDGMTFVHEGKLYLIGNGLDLGRRQNEELDA